MFRKEIGIKNATEQATSILRHTGYWHDKEADKIDENDGLLIESWKPKQTKLFLVIKTCSNCDEGMVEEVTLFENFKKAISFMKKDAKETRIMIAQEKGINLRTHSNELEINNYSQRVTELAVGFETRYAWEIIEKQI